VKKEYSAPVLVEYGGLTELTRGAGGALPDFVLDPGPPVSVTRVNNACDATGGGIVTGCLIVAS